MKRLGGQLQLELIRIDFRLQSGFEIWLLLKIEKHLAIDEAITVVVFVQVPSGDIAFVRRVVICSPAFAIKNADAFKRDYDFLLFAVSFFDFHFKIRPREG